MAHPNNAAYVSADGLVSFDRYGIKLDSNGNRVFDGQSAGDAGATELRRPEPPQPAFQANGSMYSVMPTQGAPQRSTWDNSVLTPGGAPGGTVASPMGTVDVNRPVRQSLQNYDTFAARAGWRAPSNWEAGNTAQAPRPQAPTYNFPVNATGQAQIPMQVNGLGSVPMPQAWRTPAVNMPYPPTGNSMGNQYIPETYTRQTVPVYDPQQLSWVIP